MRLLIVTCIIHLSALSQDKFSFDIGFGFLKNNTREKLIDHMSENGYNHYVVNSDQEWFSPKDSISFDIKHPFEKGISSTLFCKVFYLASPKNKVGLVLNYNSFGCVTGNNKNFEEYKVEINAVEIFPTYKFEPNKNLSFTIAPGIIINSIKGTYEGFTEWIPINEMNTSICAGLNIGAFLQIPFKRSYLYTGGTCSLQTEFNTGVLNSTSSYPLASLRINNSYAGLVFGLGFLLGN